MLEEIINFVTPFRQAIKELSDQQKPTLYLVVVWYTRLVQEMQPENTDSLLINALKAEARTQLLHVGYRTSSCDVHGMSFLRPWSSYIRIHVGRALLGDTYDIEK